jgi:hypothetical protein
MVTLSLGHHLVKKDLKDPENRHLTLRKLPQMQLL